MKSSDSSVFIREEWSKQRNLAGTKAALENVAIQEWFSGLNPDDQNRARRIFGKINELTTERPEQRLFLFKHGVLAFEAMKAKENLDALESITAENIVQFGEVFGTQDELEATFYYQIVQARIEVVRALKDRTEEDALEAVIQKHLFEHLWLLDPSWERAATTEYMERRVSTEFAELQNKPSDDEAGRVDIKYRTTAGKHVIVELKRASVVTDTATLLAQVDKYRTCLRRILEDIGDASRHIDTVCVVGKPLRDWANPPGREESEHTLGAKNIRVITYAELLQSAYKSYQEFLDKSAEAGRIVQLLKSIGDEEGDGGSSRVGSVPMEEKALPDPTPVVVEEEQSGRTGGLGETQDSERTPYGKLPF